METKIFVNPAEFGLEESKAQQIKAQFEPMLNAMVELEKEFNIITTLPVEEQTTSLAARTLRLKYVKVRSATEKIHKAQKAFYLAGGRFVDGWKNAQAFASQEIEETLEAIENHFTNLEKARVAQLQEDREALLAPFNLDGFNTLNLGEMSEQVWDIFYSGTVANAKAKKEAEAKAEEARLEAQRIEVEEKERMRKENEALREKVAEEERKAREAAATAQAVIRAQAAKAEKERKEAERLAAEERAKQEKVIADLRAAEERRLRLIEEEREAELSRGDDEKFQQLLMDLDAIRTKYAFKGQKNIATFSLVCDLITKTIIFINQKIKA